MKIHDVRKIIGGNKGKRLPQDLFIKRLRSLVIGEGMLHDGNIYLIDHALKYMPEGGNVIEIGSYGGLSTNLILYLLKKHGRNEKVFTCDPWIYEGYEDESGNISSNIDGREDISRKDYSDYMKNAFIQGIQFLNPKNLPHSFQLTSDDFFSEYANKKTAQDIFGNETELGGPISFAYIDGNHALEFVKRDFGYVNKFLMKSGFILFDDSSDDLSFGSAVFMKEMMKNTDYQLVDKNPHYLFKKRG